MLLSSTAELFQFLFQPVCDQLACPDFFSTMQIRFLLFLASLQNEVKPLLRHYGNSVIICQDHISR